MVAKREGRINALKAVVSRDLADTKGWKASEDKNYKERLISMCIVNFAVSKRTAKEEVEAVILFMEEKKEEQMTLDEQRSS